MKKELGGQRLGNGKKMEVAMRNYERSSHDLGRVWRSSMAPGVLTPCFSEIALNGDTWKIDIDSIIRTLPTTGPLFGSFKFQVDVFSCPIRLYQGLLHNNAVSIGLKMSQVKLPMARVQLSIDNKGVPIAASSINASSLWHFLGLKENYYASLNTIEQTYCGLKILMYYDIFKNYYANKQEQNFKLISGGEKIYGYPENVSLYYQKQRSVTQNQGNTNSTPYVKVRRGYAETPTSGGVTIPVERSGNNRFSVNKINVQNTVDAIDTETGNIIRESVGNATPIRVEGISNFVIRATFVLPVEVAKRFTVAEANKLTTLRIKNTNMPYTIQPAQLVYIIEGVDAATRTTYPKEGYRYVEVYYGSNSVPNPDDEDEMLEFYAKLELKPQNMWLFDAGTGEPKIIDVPLENIDKGRREILKKCELGDQVTIGSGTNDVINFQPYITNTERDNNTGLSNNAFPLNGLVLKTYNSDLFNNWLNSELISGTGGISELSAVDITADKLSLDALNLKQKIYNMLNRIVASGNTYEDWQEAIWGEEAIRRAESPIYQGGMSGEIVFEEVVSSSESESEETGNQPIGTLAGKGTLTGKHGGKIEIDVKEPSIIMAIASITPRVDYAQGISWDLTELKTLDDLHKPELDGIGFQNLPVQWMWGNGGPNLVVGKQPAWIQYMTAVNEVHGDFAEESGAAFMTLQKRFDWDSSGKAKGLTTYIDPVMFNTAFAVESLSAQNFWVQIGFDAVARRKMSAKIIPNL